MPSVSDVGARRLRLSSGLLSSILAIAAPATAAPSEEKVACIAASDDAQALRDAGKLLEARARLVTCARDVCPGPVRADCATWLSEVDANTPTVVLTARDNQGLDLSAVKVTMDGQPIRAALDGASIPLDPGTHVFRFESTGRAAVVQQVILRQGERNRAVAATMLPTVVEPSVSPTAARGAPIAGIVTAGAGAAALGVATYFWITGTEDLNALQSGCGVTHSCHSSSVDAARTTLVAGDVTGAVGIVLAGVGVGLLLKGWLAPAKQSASHPLLTVGVAPAPGGWRTSFALAF